MIRRTFLAMTAAVAFSAPAFAADMDIVDTAVGAGSFTTLVAAVTAAGLVDTLKGEGPFTVFAPTDAAFAALPAGTVEDLLKPENKDKLTAILTYHVVPGKVMAADLTEGMKAATVNGAEVTITAPRAFSLNAFDAAFFPLPTPVGLFAGAQMGLKIVGTLWDGGTVEGAVSLLEDPNFAGDFLFASYSAGSSPLLRSVTLGACVFTGIDCERSGAAFDAAGFLFNDLQFAIDNLSVSIPEPSALWLVALSLSGLALTRRRSAQ